MKKAGYIAIIGRPNAGKSTLLNQVLQTELSIVSHKAQTTRDQINGILSDPKCGQIVFVDTPGIHRAKDGGINQYMVQQAQQSLDSPDLVWYLVDPHSELKHETAVLELLQNCSAPVCLLFNKADIARTPVMRERSGILEKAFVEDMKVRKIKLAAVSWISALTGKGVAELLESSWKGLPDGEPFYPDPEQLSDRPTRFFVSEKIREKLFEFLGEELPYACAVEITKFQEDSKPPRIEATIHVERDSQKGMVIGDRGKKIKEIGQSARGEIEKFLGTQIFLGLKVELLRDWSKNAEALRKIGYDIASRKKPKNKPFEYRDKASKASSKGSKETKPKEV